MAQRDQSRDLEDRLIGFAVMMTNVAESLPTTRTGDHIAGQLIRSGTSPAPNYGEAHGAESHRDFVHKLRAVFKEFRETRAWLQIVRTRGMIADSAALGPGIRECDELVRIAGASLRTARSRELQPAELNSASAGSR